MKYCYYVAYIDIPSGKRHIMHRKTNIINLTKADKQKTTMTAFWKATVERQHQKAQLKGTEHIPSPPLSRLLLLSLMCEASCDLAADRFRPASLGSVGPVQPCSRDSLRFDTLCTSLESRRQPAAASDWPSFQPASQPAWYSYTLFGVSAREPCWERGLAVWLTGLRWTADGAFCPLTPGGHTEKVGVGNGGRQVRLCSTCCPPPPTTQPPTTTPSPLLRVQDRCLWHWFWKRQRPKRSREGGRGEWGLGGAWGEPGRGGGDSDLGNLLNENQ